MDQSIAKISKALEDFDNSDVVDMDKIPELKALLEAFPPGFFSTIQITKLQLVNMLQDLGSAVQYNRTLPIKCTGTECAIRHICPFDKMGIAPVGFECALERVSMDEWRRQYVQSMNIDTRDKIQMSLVDELVEIDIFNKYRFPAILSENVYAFQEQIDRLSDKTGTLVESRKEVSKAFEAKMMMAKRREFILRELLATPKQKVQHKLIKPIDPSKELSDLGDKAAAVLADIEDITDDTTR